MKRFWDKVQKGPGCWVWQGCTTGGYGRFVIGSRSDGTRKADRAHRVAWQLTNGPIPAGMFVCHTCDNPPCVNPNHLFLGTHLDNMQDMTRKGRHGTKGAHPGEAHHNARLTDETVRNIVELYRAGDVSQQRLARQFNIAQSYVSKLTRGVRRKGLT